MAMTDPIADYLTRIRNAVGAKKKFVEVPASKIKIGITEILKNNNFINDYTVIEDNKQNVLRISLKYIDEVPSISGLKRISTPGLRVYVGKESIPRVINGLGVAVLSTNKGLVTDKQARSEAIGGEVICHIW